jgi:hypothetical protein
MTDPHQTARLTENEVLYQHFRRLEERIDKLQERVHNNYEALIGKILELDAHLDAHISRLEESLERTKRLERVT